MKYQRIKNYKVECINCDNLLHFLKNEIQFPDLPKDWLHQPAREIFQKFSNRKGSLVRSAESVSMRDFTGFFKTDGEIICPCCYTPIKICSLQVYTRSTLLDRFKEEPEMTDTVKDLIQRDDIRLIYRYSSNVEKIYFPNVEDV